MSTTPAGNQASSDQRLSDLIARLNTLGSPVAPPTNAPSVEGRDIDPTMLDPSNPFVPWVPESLAKANLTENEVESLLLKFLLARGSATGHDCAKQLKLPFRLLEPLIRAMKSEQVIIYKSSTSSGDYVLQLSDMGRERGRRYVDVSTYFGSAPVSLRDYAFAVAAQSIQHQKPREPQLKEAFKDLAIPPEMLMKLGPAISAGKGMFLYGYPGNGKTSIAERVTRAFGPTIWIPRAIGVDGEIIRLYDPVSHEEVPLPRTSPILQETNIDQRWIRVKRPTVVVGGELTMDQLEVSFNRSTGIGEAPIQMKANCGTLVIDDFGRQCISTSELLNRWIVPLEKGYDYLNTLSGKKIQVPFDELVVFSTNLEPRDLVDDAFLRRIPYKIEVRDPNEEQFRGLFRIMCPKFGLEYRDDMITYLLQKHYAPTKRAYRYCHPRDLLLQIKFFCDYLEKPMEMTPRSLDFAAENYFSVV